MFKNNGVYRLVENPQAEGSDGRQGKGNSSKRKVLVHLPSGEVVSSYAFLEQILTGLGWERYYDGDPDLYQFHKHSSIDLISLPKDFSKFNSINMYDIVIKNPNVFHVRDKWLFILSSSSSLFFFIISLYLYISRLCQLLLGFSSFFFLFISYKMIDAVGCMSRRIWVYWGAYVTYGYWFLITFMHFHQELYILPFLQIFSLSVISTRTWKLGF